MACVDIIGAEAKVRELILDAQKPPAPTAAGPWIPVTERMPEVGHSVLVWDGGTYAEVVELVSINGRHRFEHGDGRRLHAVTHWAELRKPGETP
jgi:hypothetical protein